jgi:4-aminobutyrate aminotransferase-like enzyme
LSRRAPLRGDELPAILVAPPGPKSRAAAKRLRRAEGAAIWGASPPAAAPPIVWARARGSVVEDLDGNRYLDLTSGFGAASLGHAAPEVARAVAAQARKMAQGLGDLHPHTAREKLARRLSALGGPLSKVLLATTGSEAVELALKTAALATGRRRVVAFEGAYHGQTGAALEVTHFPASPALTRAAGPPRAIHIPFPDPDHCPLGRACGTGAGSCDLSCFEEGWKRVERECAGPDPPGAVIVEPIQGRAGVIVPPLEFLPRLCARARALGLVVIYDEIMTGAGRTGPFWAWERSGSEAEPDLLAAGKGLGGGVAIAALLGKPELMEVWAKHASPSGEAPYASTYYAHPLACAGALATIGALTRPAGDGSGTPARPDLARDLRAAVDSADGSILVRCAGRMAAAEWRTRDASRGADPAGMTAALRALLGAGVLAIPGGREGNVLSILPARSLTEEQWSHAVRALALAAAAP